MAKSSLIFKRIEELSRPDVETRRKAARKLGDMGDVRAVPPLCLALRDDDPHVRRAAATSLGILREPDAMQPLQEALKDRREGLRGAAAWAVGQIGKRHTDFAVCAVRLIVEAAQKDKPRERHRYVTALTAMELAAASPLCVEFSSRRSESSQQCVLLALRSLQYHQHLEVTRHLLADAVLLPVQVWDALEMLEAGRPPGFFASRRFPIARRVCEIAADNPNEPENVQQGAKRVLEYLSLGRASEFHDPNAGAHLLRMASTTPQTDSGETLLRGAEADTQPHKMTFSPVCRWVNMWRGRLQNLQDWLRSR